jgi:hypothetical protein
LCKCAIKFCGRAAERAHGNRLTKIILAADFSAGQGEGIIAGMNLFSVRNFSALAVAALFAAGCANLNHSGTSTATPELQKLFYETSSGRTALPAQLLADARAHQHAEIKTSDGRTVAATVTPNGENYTVELTASPSEGIEKWGVEIGADTDEYFTGLMERVVDGRQHGDEFARAKGGHDSQADDFGLRAIFFVVARLRDVRAGQLAGAI